MWLASSPMVSVCVSAPPVDARAFAPRPERLDSALTPIATRPRKSGRLKVVEAPDWSVTPALKAVPP